MLYHANFENSPIPITNERNGLKIGHYKPNIKISNSAKYHLHTFLLPTAMIF